MVGGGERREQPAARVAEERKRLLVEPPDASLAVGEIRGHADALEPVEDVDTQGPRLQRPAHGRQSFSYGSDGVRPKLRRVSFLPLDGLRVLDVTSSLAGPYCTEILSALGADVVKVERADGGDETRAWWPAWNGEGVMFLCANAGKRSLALDLSEPRALEVLLRLAGRADVFVQSLRPGLAERRGPRPEALRARNEHPVYC